MSKGRFFMKTAFVILHYQNDTVTKRCVHTLLELEGIGDHEIVIVDNASANGSGEKLRQRYEAYPNIHVLLSQENMGFARGNNMGYLYAKQTLGAELMVVMNSDVFIYDKDFPAAVENAFRETGADIIGPEIYAVFHRLYQNPLAPAPMTPEEAKSLYEELQILLARLARPIIGSCYTFYNHAMGKLRSLRTKKVARCPQRLYGIVPHGSCVLYGKNWVQREDIAFLPDTFFYGEEHILSYYARQKGYTICYVPELYVEHEAGATRNFAFDRETKKLRYFYEQELAAVKILLDMMEK